MNYSSDWIKQEKTMKKIELLHKGFFRRTRSQARKIAFLLMFFLTIGFYAAAQYPTVTVRFYNPRFDCVDSTYCVDVQFLSDTEGQQLFSINVRFFYDDNQLEFTSFGNYAEGYGPYDPDPPLIQTGPAGSGPTWFGLTGSYAEYINGAVQLLDFTTIYLDTEEWTTIFSICFDVDDPTAFQEENFCPPLVWDLEENPQNGGFITGSNGPVILLVSEDPFEPSSPANTNVWQFNWAYDGVGGTPYGYPEPTDCITLTCAFDDFGDAPEGAPAYPDSSILGQFPTCLDTVLAGFIKHSIQNPPMAYFGPVVDAETDGNAGACSPYAPYNFDECFQDQDAGLLIPSPYTINGSGNYTGCSVPGTALINTKDTVRWGPGNNLDIMVTNLLMEPVYVNLLIDWNRSGYWDYDPNTTANNVIIPEHCLVNFPVPPGFTGPLSMLNPPVFYSSSHKGHVWARFSITEVPVIQNWDGAGEFAYGETEDYLFYISSIPEFPVSDWALALGIFLIAAFTVFKLRKN